MLKELEARRYYVSGMVQGVGFRFFVERVAERLGLAGYVRNLRDGRLEVYAIGAPEALRVLKSELRRGPHMASIQDVGEDEAAVELQYTGEFTIERDS